MIQRELLHQKSRKAQTQNLFLSEPLPYVHLLTEVQQL